MTLFSYKWKSSDIFLLFFLSFGLNIALSFILQNILVQYPLLALALQLIVFVSALLYVCIIRNKNIKWKDIGFIKISFFKSLGLTLLAWFSVMSILAYIVTVWGDIPGFQQQESYEMFFGDSIITKIIFAIFAIVTAPLLEEIMFRGILLNWSTKYLHPILAIITNGLLFGLAHLEMQSLFAVSLIGMALASITYYSKSIYPAILFHFINNTIAVIVTFSL